MLRPAILISSVALLLASVRAQTVEENPSFKAALGALEDKLPDLAITKLKAALTAFPEDEAAQATIRLKLGEASVRTARITKGEVEVTTLAREALESLAAPALRENEQAIFWSAQASLLLGEFEDAVSSFARLASAADLELRNHALFSQAHLLSALNRHEEAGQLLEALANSDDQSLAGEARLLHASLMLAQGKLDEADVLIPENLPLGNPGQVKLLRYLRARLLAQREEFEQAAAAFRSLLEDAGTLPVRLHHGALVSLSESLHQLDEEELAIETLITLIDKHPRSLLLPQAFARLIQWASTETLKQRIEEQMSAWGGTAPPLEGEAPRPNPAPRDVVITSETALRTGYALYYYALHLASKSDAKSNELAESLLARLQTKLPSHPLHGASLLERAKLQAASQRGEEAVETLLLLEKSTTSPILLATARQLIGQLKFEEGEFQPAADAFLEARTAGALDADDALPVNAAICLLRAGNESEFRDLLHSIESPETRVTLLLEQALSKAAQQNKDARPALDTFLREHRMHPRAVEARLAFAEECLRFDPHLEAARQQASAQLAELKLVPLNDQLALRRLLIRLRLAELSGEWQSAITASKKFLRDHNPGDLSPAIRLKLAEAYFNNGNLAEAQVRFQELASSAEDPVIKEVALFFAARSALTLGTESSRKEASQLLSEVIAGKGPLANDASLLLAHSIIEESSNSTDANPTSALTVLAPLLADESHPKQVDALMLAAAAHRAHLKEGHYEEALRIYDRLLARNDLPYALSNQVHSLKGQVFEQLERPGDALDTYYLVIKRENLPPGEEQTEWRYFTECGFKAVKLLEQGSPPRWDSAVDIFRIIEKSGSPWAGEASELRRAMQLKHQLFDIE